MTSTVTAQAHPPPAAADVTPASLSLHLGSSTPLRARTLQRGLSVIVGSSEGAQARYTLTRGAKVLRSGSLTLVPGATVLRLKAPVKSGSLKLTLSATDAAGNTASRARTLRVWP